MGVNPMHPCRYLYDFLILVFVFSLFFLSSFFRLLLEASSSPDTAVNWVLRGWRNTWRPRPSPSLSNRRIHKCYLVSLSFFFLVFSMYDYTNRLLYTVTYIYYLILVFLFAVIACAKILYFELYYWPTLRIKIMLFSWIFYGTETIYFCTYVNKNYIFRCKTRKCGLNAVTSAGPPCTRARGQLSCETIARFSDSAGKTWQLYVSLAG